MCMVLPGVLISAVMLAAMIVHMQTAFSKLCSNPVFSLYPQEQIAQNTIFFPHSIQGTSLVAERLAAYDGPFVEDGTHDEVTGIAALVLHNKGTQPLEYATIVLQQGTRSLTFRARAIGPGDTVLVLEADRQHYERSPCQSCTGKTVADGNILLNTMDLQITVSQRNCITVTNRTNRTLADICLDYKGWLEEPGICIGGITYTAVVGDLAPGESVSVRADCFVDGYSRIVRITCK